MSDAADRWLSLNEVEMLAGKAARGAGAGWGVAEDLGRAARWLAERGLPWACPMIEGLGDAEGLNRLRPAFRAADRAAGAQAGEAWTVELCALIWTVPILATAWHGRAFVLHLSGDRCSIRLGPNGAASADVPWPDLAGARPQRLALRVDADGASLAERAEPDRRRSRVTPAEWLALQVLASRTTVAASARSRVAGAGGGRVDDE